MLIGRGSTICLPVIAICGATGTGKSRLAIDIARLFNGEVINVDSMQLYEGLDIATNKITLDQAAGVPHHLLGTLPADLVGRIDVRDYRNQCLNLIDKIRLENNHIPILAGGTHYYLESVLWSDFLSKSPKITSSQDAEILSRYL
ncbi:tRNA dimethylallyltransferase [Fasciolopsis buskii]|uniref:tRNA dimethylallyltransferase n=1 Tax=Fasciolopsis buskii TaxID=27845 RepID=A0A8E0S964_9TREM|nr:tRNA dimethylallyltransferase [Fasciolopsis buski]